MKKSSRSLMLDKAHVWTVRGLMGLTLLGCLTASLQVYSYFKYVRPERLQERRERKETEIAIEQEEREMELLRKQKDAENQWSA